MTRTIDKVTVLGTGVLGSQIAFQTAFHGVDVVAYDISDEILETAKQRFQGLAARYAADLPDAGTRAEEALGRVTYSSDLGAAVRDADLVVEAVPEALELKQQVYTQLGELAPERTIFASNSSTLLPSAMVEFTGRPDRFLALHFANEIWLHNTAEVMGTPRRTRTSTPPSSRSPAGSAWSRSSCTRSSRATS